MFHVSTPKTKAGIRVIPMLEAVRKALLEERLSQMRTGFNQTVIDGYSGFIFSNRYGDALTHTVLTGQSSAYPETIIKKKQKLQRKNGDNLNFFHILQSIIFVIHSAHGSVRMKPTSRLSKRLWDMPISPQR